MIICPLERLEYGRSALARKYPDIYNEVYKDGYNDGYNDGPSSQDIKDVAKRCLKLIKVLGGFIKKMVNKNTTNK